MSEVIASVLCDIFSEVDIHTSFSLVFRCSVHSLLYVCSLQVVSLKPANSWRMLILYVPQILSPWHLSSIYIHAHIFKQGGKCLLFSQREGKVVVLSGIFWWALSRPCSTKFGNIRQKAHFATPHIGVTMSVMTVLWNPPGWGGGLEKSWCLHHAPRGSYLISLGIAWALGGLTLLDDSNVQTKLPDHWYRIKLNKQAIWICR